MKRAEELYSSSKNNGDDYFKDSTRIVRESKNGILQLKLIECLEGMFLSMEWCLKGLCLMPSNIKHIPISFKRGHRLVVY